jgi:ABC-type antimicrobial peptide transport system permease subunit
MIGLVLGGAAAVASARFLESQLFGVTPFDAATYISAIFVITLAGFLASWVPARKAAALNPVELIRAE